MTDTTELSTPKEDTNKNYMQEWGNLENMEGFLETCNLLRHI